MRSTCKYLIIGGGMAADAAAHGIRDIDKAGTITMLSAEQYKPYDRPPLSKKLWAGKPLSSIWRSTDDIDIDLRLETRALECEPEMRKVTDERGNVYTYEKLLLATGGNPRRLPFADDGVIYFRNLTDYRAVREVADRNGSFVVIGGGFIGSEIAAALVMNGRDVNIIFPSTGIGTNIYPPALSSFITRYFQEKGVTLLTRENVVAIEKSSRGMTVRTDAEKTLQCDAVIAGIGIEPELDLAKSIGLDIDNGIVVDEFLRSSYAGIYAAGDVANFYCSALDIRRRVEHEDSANTMGTIAGHNMAGRPEKYDHLPYFYSDLFDLGYEAVGELDADMEMVEDWVDPYRKGVVYYLEDNRVRGVLLWNTWDRIDTARQLISAGETLSPQALKGYISE